MNIPPDVQAANWLAMLQRDDISAAERAELERWLEDDPAHAVAFARAEFAWQRAERLRALPKSTRASLGSFPSWERAQAGGWLAAAAVALMIIGGALWYYTTQWHAYATSLGERRTVALEDGSQVNLNTSSRLEIDYDGETRAVRLIQGEALFKVANDPQRPFVVKAGETVVRALGTAFNVRMQNRVVEVTVTEGAVAVDGENRVVKGSSIVAAAGALKRASLTEEAVRRRVAWREGIIELKGETLEQAAQEFNRYRRSKLVVADSTIATLRVGGRFETDEAEKFINALKANFNIRAVKGDGGSTYLIGPEATFKDGNAEALGLPAE